MTIRFRLAYLLGAVFCLGWTTTLHTQVQAPPVKRVTKDTSFTYSVLYSFDSPVGLGPSTTLIQASDGNYYGVTGGGGANDPEVCNGGFGCGTVFKFAPPSTITTLYNFCDQTNCADGFAPYALIQGGDGNFYGVTYSGGNTSTTCPYGDYGCGVIFRLTPAGEMTTLYEFCSKAGCSDGIHPNYLIEGSDGNIYGTTQEGGNSSASLCAPFGGCGTIFKITPAGSFTTLHTFCSLTNCDDGILPFGGLLQASDGNFYSTAELGGTGSKNSAGYSGGVFFRMTSAGALTVLYNFCGELPCPNGTGPNTNFTQGADGNLYGTAAGGGSGIGGCFDEQGCGTVFKITTSGSITTLYSFCSQSNCADGGLPNGGLFLASDGNYYGQVSAGGANEDACLHDNCGTVFEVSASGDLTTLHSFCAQSGCADGDLPSFNTPLQGNDGNIYGETTEGGTNNYGVVFALAPSATLSAPVQPSLSESSISLNNSVALTWQVLNAFSTTMQQCYAFVQNSATGAGTWTGLQSGTLTSGIYSGSTSITPTATGTYTYALTCGGIESGFATLTVTAATTPDITFSSVTHNMGSVLIGNSTTYGVQLTNHTGNVFPFALTLSSTASPNPFSYQTNCGTSVAAYAKCEIVFTYAPKSGNTGTQTATWSLAPNGFTFGPSNGGTLTGSVATAANLTVTTAGHNWGDQTVGTSSPVYGVVLTNSTPNNLNMTYALGNTIDFNLVTNCPALLGAGISCNLNFTFTPKSAGFPSTTESLTATDAKTSSPVTIYIKGSSTPVTGIALKGTGD